MMNQSLEDHSDQVNSFSLARPWKFLDLIHDANKRTLTIAAIMVALAWVPLAVLSVLKGGDTFVSFLTDYASQSRLLIIIPILILAAPNLNERLSMVTHHLETFVPQNQLSKFQTGWASFERLRDSKLARAIIILLTYAGMIWLEQYVSPEGIEINPWIRGEGSFRWYSLAGTWGLFVSYPILIYLTLLWLWRQVLWTWFMRFASTLDLRLVAAHPDSLGGLGFLEASLRGQLPFSFCLGVGLAGAVANRMFHHGEKLISFGPVAGVLVGAVLLICVVPYIVFTPILMQMRRRGMLSYGAFARAAGEQFERKWLNRDDAFDQEFFTMHDFSATNGLFGVVRNINEISIFPVGRVDLYALFVVAFIPAIPVVIGAIPIATVARAAIKMLL